MVFVRCILLDDRFRALVLVLRPEQESAEIGEAHRRFLIPVLADCWSDYPSFHHKGKDKGPVMFLIECHVCQGVREVRRPSFTVRDELEYVECLHCGGTGWEVAPSQEMQVVEQTIRRVRERRQWR